MNTAMVIINLALAAYSVGVWSERIAGRLKPWHLTFFWCGIVFDTWGTGLMFGMAGGMTLDVHGISGFLAIFLMFVHAVWATAVLVRKQHRLITTFHRFSVTVWVIWLVPYFSPMVFHLAARP